MACSYDTQTVPEMLFDIDTDNDNNNDSICGDSNRDSSRMIVARTKCAITRSLFNIRKVR